MRRKADGSVLPPELRVFDGRGFSSPWEWEAALAAFHEARARWAGRRGISEDELPRIVFRGHCPFDAEWAVGPVDPATHDVVYRADGSVERISRR